MLKDLAVFCFANASTFDKDKSSEQNLVAQGRREVWLRIANHLHLSPDELWALYDGRVDDDTA